MIRPVGQPTLRAGFVPLADCAPLVLAQELGLFRQHNLNVVLSRELGWATVRDKIILGELDVAHALAAMPLAATLGLGSIRCACVSGLVLNQHGNAITLSNELWRRGVSDGGSLRAEVRRGSASGKLTFGVVHPFSSHRHLLRQWLRQNGMDPDRDARIVIVPPPQMAANLKAGHLDGFCAGEPWNSVAVRERAGWIAATSAELDPGHPEKVVMARADFALQRAPEHLAFLAALIAACEFCDRAENHGFMAEVLARPEYVGVPASILRRAFDGTLDIGHDRTRRVDDFCVFHRGGANEPTASKAAWVLQLARASGLCPEPLRNAYELGEQIYRMDLYTQAAQLAAQANFTHRNEPEYENLLNAQ